MVLVDETVVQLVLVDETVLLPVLRFTTFANLVIDDVEVFSCLRHVGCDGFLKLAATSGDTTKNTAEVCLNAAKDACRSLHKQHAIFIDNDENKQWQATLVKRMIDAIKVACIEGGVRFEKPKTAPTGSGSLKKISTR